MENTKVERFGFHELTELRNGLLESGLDSFQAAQLLSVFLAGRGYGIGAEQARDMILRLNPRMCSTAHIQREIERTAFVM